MTCRPAASGRQTVDASRQAAFAVLRAVEEDGAYANLALPRLLRDRHIRGRDAAFATELTFGTLRWRGTYDVVIGACSSRSRSDTEPTVQAALRVGAHQLLGMRVPAHAAVATTVDLVRSAGRPGAAGFTNAVLRKVAQRTKDEWIAALAPTDPDARLAFAFSHPLWIVQGLRDALGPNPDELAALLEADNTAPSVSLVARPGRATVDELLAAGAASGRWSPVAATLESGDPAELSAVREHRAGVQNEGSQLVTLALTQVPVECDDSQWLDMCAGPGGKAALLDAVAALRPATQLTAVEPQPHRAKLVEQVVTAATQVVIGDATADRFATESFSRVLVDAPCTGLGALRRRPDARWRREPTDVVILAALQRALLDNACRAVAVGGVVAYTTCSPLVAETTDIVRHCLVRHAEMHLIDARPYLPGVSDLGEGPTVQLWPHRHDTDAMFLALLRRAS